jgi:peptidoglycan hydrolase-like protein with peptidoglycan-binding domain
MNRVSANIVKTGEAMKKNVLLICLIALGAATSRADDQIRTVQEQLKAQGFYYGNVDGEAGSETSAAIRRFQIRNGLQVTGSLNQETLDSLRASGAPQPSQPQPANPGPAQPQPGLSGNETDRDFLRNQGQPQPTAPPRQAYQPEPEPPQAPPQSDTRVVSPPVAITQQPSELGGQYALLFKRTPYENAPVEVQQSTLKKAQLHLSHSRFYSGAIDGIPGSGTERAIVLFQGAAGLTQSGQLDMATLDRMHLLPADHRQVLKPFYPPPPYYQPHEAPRVYRGIWIQ